jgi:CheY-like chemotaxis protein
MRSKILVLAGPSTPNAAAIETLKTRCEVIAADSLEKAIDLLRHEKFAAIFSDADDFLPLERALVSQQANLILNTIGEGVCIVDGEGRCTWMNKKMSAWPKQVHERIRRTCQEAFDLFSMQISPQTESEAPAFSRSKRYAMNIDDQQFLEMIASPVIPPGGKVMQVAAVVWDATGTRRLQQRIDAVDKAGRELVRLEGESLAKLHVGQRLKLLEEKIVSFTRDLLHFDHFAIRVLDRKTNKLEIVISAGLPEEALSVDLFASTEGNGISGYVAATGRSYICPDVQRDPRYVKGLEEARSSLTVPLQLYDNVIGIFNIESRQLAAFNEDDRQFAEIFGRYVAIALNVLNLLVRERVDTSHKVADDVNAEVAAPLNDIELDVEGLMNDYIGQDELRAKLQTVLDNVGSIRKCLKQVAEGPNTAVLGANDTKVVEDPILRGAQILVADDEPNIRDTICNVLKRRDAIVTVCPGSVEAIAELEKRGFDLVVSDIRMPGKSGYDVFDSARKRDAKLPVILMTGFGYDPEHSIVRASKEGLQAVLFKPFRVEQLLNEVRKALQLRVRGGSSEQPSAGSGQQNVSAGAV